MKYSYVLAWIAGGACVIGFFAIQLSCSDNSLTLPQALRPQALRLAFPCGSAIGDIAICFLVYCTIVIQIFAASSRADKARILGRSYLSVIPLGVAPFGSSNEILSCDVAFCNRGKIPATNVRWFIDRKLIAAHNFDDFPIEIDLRGSNIIFPNDEVIKGARAIRRADLDAFKAGGDGKNRWLYVWGRVAYSDSFSSDRYTDFCFRYNLAGSQADGILARSARQHMHGNRADGA